METLEVYFQRQIRIVQPKDSTILRAKTYSVPALAIKKPAIKGPMILDALRATPFSAKAEGNCSRATRSGTIAANTGQRIARPIPLVKVKNSNNGALSELVKVMKHRTAALNATQSCVAIKYFLRSRISANAPLGRPNKNTGRLEAV